jgi:uncharacterized protein YeaO (DUF488 family)
MQTTSHGDASQRSGPQGRRVAGSRKGDGHVRIAIKRAYEPGGPHDGQRILVDRLWPRGLSKHDLADVVWIRDVAPSAELRKWFGHKPERWGQFRSRYFAELRANPAVAALQDLIARGPVTLLYGARDEVHNQAVALADYLGGAAGSAAEADR